MSKIKTHVRKGDQVKVLVGPEGIKGAQGEVTSIKHTKRGPVVTVEGVRMIKKGIRPSEENRDGGFEEKEGPIHISNVKKVD